MDSFKRMFKYVWPQWPRLITVVVTAIVCAALFALSFMTIIPLLKVMMGEEGLHSWVDRKTCDYRYGMDFYVPDMADVTDAQSSDLDIVYCLVVTGIEEDGIADKAGLGVQDKITGIGPRTAP